MSLIPDKYCITQQMHTPESRLRAGTHIANTTGGGRLMRSQVFQRYSTAAALTTLAVMAAQALNLSLSIPSQPIQLAWTLTRVLLQL